MTDTLRLEISTAIARSLAQKPADRETLRGTIGVVADVVAAYVVGAGEEHELDLRSHFALELAEAMQRHSLDIPAFLRREAARQ
jgi:hypothetical protein